MATKSLVKQTIQNDTTTEWQADIHQVIKWHEVLNTELFKGRAPAFNSIIIKLRCDAWGLLSAREQTDNFYFELKLERKFNSLTHFLDVLAHEMLHGVEYFETGNMAHGRFFWSWEKRFAKKGLTLKDSY